MNFEVLLWDSQNCKWHDFFFWKMRGQDFKVQGLINYKMCAFYYEPIFVVVRVVNSCVGHKTAPAIFGKKRFSLSLLCLSKPILKVKNGRRCQHLAPPELRRAGASGLKNSELIWLNSLYQKFMSSDIYSNFGNFWNFTFLWFLLRNHLNFERAPEWKMSFRISAKKGLKILWASLFARDGRLTKIS